MAKNGSLAEELKALGQEVAGAAKQAYASKEFKMLEHEITTSAKKISSSIMKSLKAAKDSKTTGKLKKRMGRVVKIGAQKGGAEAQKAQKAALSHLKKLSASFKKLAKAKK